MSNTIDAHVTENLRRWQASGQPRAWVESHGGHWEHSDWLTLLANLRHSEFWPLEAAEVGALLEKLRRERFNLHRLDQSGLLGRWVEARRGQWNDTDCLALLEYLRDTGFWPIQSEVVRRVLEGATREWHNLRRWEQSGQGRRWAEAHGGEWHHGDWLSLVGMLQQSEFWPLDLVAVGAVLEGLKQAASNLRCWIGSGWPRRWVDDQRGRWEHDHWLVLLEALRRSPYWPLDEDSVGRTVEEFRRKRQNLQRWERSGQARQWVSARQGRWEHEDWLALLDGLSHSEFWPVDAEAVGEVLADIQTEWRNLRCWQESVEVRKWLGDRQGRWGRDEWLSLQASL